MGLDGLTALSGMLVGIVVGITGVGGGALMTPILVLIFGVAPQTAVGTDLLYASITKIFGVGVHQSRGSVDWQIVRRMALGSLPAAALTLAWMHSADANRVTDGLIIQALAVALIITAIGMLMKNRLHEVGRRMRVGPAFEFQRAQHVSTVLAGALLGVLVTLTSIGAGALGTVLMVYLYPLRLTPNKLVGTDLAHAIPLAMLAGLGHLVIGNVDFGLLGNLLLGSIPGVVIGALLGTRVPSKWVQVSISLVLIAVAVKLLMA